MSLPDTFIPDEESSFDALAQIASDSELEPFDAEDFLDCHWRTELIFRLYPEERFKNRRAILFKKIYGWDAELGEREVPVLQRSVDPDDGSTGPRAPKTILERLQRTAEELKEREDRMSREVGGKFEASFSNGKIKIHHGPTSRLQSLQRKVAELQQDRENAEAECGRREKEQRGPSFQAAILLRRYDASLKSFMILAKLNSSRG